MQKIFVSFFLLLTISYGIYLRGYELSTGSFWIDEGYSSLIAYFMTENYLLPKLGSGVYEFSQYFFHFFQALLFSWFGASDFWARVPSFIFSLFHIGVFYLFVSSLLRNSKYKNIGILFLMGLFLFSTWQIIWSREARFYELLALLYLTVIFFLYEYIQKGNKKDVIFFFVFLTIGMIFHYFFLGFLLIFVMIFGRKMFQKQNLLIIFGGGLVLLCYAMWQIFIKKISFGFVDVGGIFPSVNSMQEYHFFSFFLYYISFLYEQLGIIFISFVGGMGYFFFSKKYKELVLFGGLALINIVGISFGYFAHSRYMFHLFSLITGVGGYVLFTFGTFIIENYIYPSKKLFIAIFSTFMVGSIFLTYSITILPQRYYYIDFTSPKPNFKSAYESLADIPDLKIVSGFSHMCYWYFSQKPQVCQYAIHVDLIGNTKNIEKIHHQEKNNYTDLKYLKNISDLPRGTFYFVFDDLTLKNALDTHIIDYVKDNCQSVFRDLGDGKIENFIGVWKCEK